MRTIIVTGAAGNLGRAVVQKFLREGWRVVGTINRERAGTENHENLSLVALDLMDEAASRQFIVEMIEKYGRIDALVATVGGFTTGSIAESGIAEIYGQLRLNFDTAYNVARPCFGQMMQQKQGRIFLVASRPGLEAHEGEGMVGYGLAKSLIVRTAQLMNIEAKGIDVVTAALVPGTIDTPQNRESMPGKDFKSWVKPEAIANVISFYCSKEASDIREPVIKIYNNA